MSTKVFVCGTVHASTRDQKWQVASSTSQSTLHTVSYVSYNNSFKCTCIGFKTHKGKRCKHIQSIVNQYFTGKAGRMTDCTYNSFVHGDGPRPGICPFCQGSCYVIELDI